eukprot:UN12863
MIKPFGMKRVQISSSKPPMLDWTCDKHDWDFVLTVPILDLPFYAYIYIRNTVHVHRVKLHLPLMYMIYD